MITAENSISAKVSTEVEVGVQLNNAVIEIEPPLEDLEVTPTMEDQLIESELYGFDKVLVKGIESDSIIVEPSKEDQTFNGLYNRVMVNGEPNLVPENIPEGISMFGVDGNKKVVDTTDATATPNDMLAPATAYVNGEKIEGTIPNNGALNYTPSEAVQNIPAGYTSGGTIAAINYEELGTITPDEMIEAESITTDILS